MFTLLIMLVIGIVLIFTILFLFNYNALSTKQNEVQKAWSNLNSYLNKKADLGPRLIKIVKIYTNVEDLALENLNTSRKLIFNAHGVTEHNQANNQLSDSFNYLFSISKNYPELVKNKDFISICESVREIDKKIDDGRHKYNEAVLKYNDVCETFPYYLFKKILGFKEIEYFRGYLDFEKQSVFSFEN